MSRTYRPPRPEGESDEARYHQAVWDTLWGGKFPFKDTDTVRVDASPGSGYAIRVVLPKGNSSPPAIAITGEWDPNRVYSVNQIAFITMGANAGAYVYINSSPSSGHQPYAGGGWWIQWPNAPFGVWL